MALFHREVHRQIQRRDRGSIVHTPGKSQVAICFLINTGKDPLEGGPYCPLLNMLMTIIKFSGPSLTEISGSAQEAFIKLDTDHLLGFELFVLYASQQTNPIK